MRKINGIEIPEDIDDMLHGSYSDEFYSFQSSNTDDLINYPERARRCHEAAEFGGDGSTHAEVIEDFREFGRYLFNQIEKRLDSLASTDDEFAKYKEIFDSCMDSFNIDCDKLEEWHENNGSLNDKIG